MAGRYPMGTAFLGREDAELLGRRLAAWRVLHGVPTRSFAAALGVSPSLLLSTERNARRLLAEQARKICELTGMALEGDGASLRDRGTWHASREQAVTHKENGTRS